MKPGLLQCRDLVAPGVGEFRPAVAQHHQWTLTGFADEQVYPVGLDHAGGGHRFSASFQGFGQKI
ncbi:hypothetical protein ACVW0I_004242 [Bradyrhizobium sp. LM6.11]